MKFSNKLAIISMSSILISTQLIANTLPNPQNTANNISANTTTEERFSVKLKNGEVLELLDKNGLGYLDDMILGYSEDLKKYGLEIAAADGQRREYSSDFAPQAAIRYPSSGYKWPDGEVPYQIDNSLTSRARSDFLYAVDHWNRTTNINLVPRNGHNDYINVVNGGGCSSWIGRSGGRQTLTLASNCGRGAAVHEIGHAVGLFHEQTRTDRDDYINILWQNIQSNMSYNFQKITRSQGQDHGIYDYYSIMHYRTNAFGIGNRTTINIKDANINANLVGNSQKLSQGDINAINYMYGEPNPPVACDIINVQNNQPLILNGSKNSVQCFKLQLPDNSETYKVVTTGDNGDADLFVTHNDLATQQDYDCKSAKETSNETCSGTAQGGFVHISLFAYEAFDNLTLTASFEEKEEPVACTVQDMTVGENITINAAAKSSMCFKLSISDDVTQLKFNTDLGIGDADLYVKKSQLPSDRDFDCKSTGETSKEQCTFTMPEGDYFVRVFAWDKIENVILSAKTYAGADNIFYGEIRTRTEVDIQPDNNWFNYNGGQLQAWLSGPENADLELVLQRWNGRDKVWFDVKASTNSNSEEMINVTLDQGYYRFKIFSWNSESKGEYQFKLQL